MNVLQLHNRYQQPGGEDAVALAERRLLIEHGHSVHAHEVSNHTIRGSLGQALAGAGAVYSWRARREVAALIAQVAPDVVHVHNFFPLLSPSVYDACVAAGVPVVQTLHNYRLICPGAQLYRAGGPCEACIGKAVPWPGVVAGCYRGSRSQSLGVATMLAVHARRGTWRNRVDAFIALTAFQKDALVRAGLPAAKIHLKPNFSPDPGPPARTSAGDYALYVGRISEEKGLQILIDAYRFHGVAMPLMVAGDGPLTPALRAQLGEAGLTDRITWLGRQPPEALSALFAGARCLVLPSLWYEGLPMVALEAFAHGVPVMASAIGGLPEVVRPGDNGWLVPAGEALAWARALETAWSEPDEAIRRGRMARRDYDTTYAPEPGYRQLMAIYEGVRR